MKIKVCTKCKIERTLENSWNGTTYCKNCYNEWKRNNSLKNLEKISEKRKILWREKRSRKCKTCSKEFVGKGLVREFCCTACKLMGMIEIKNGCWVWKGDLHPNGYGYTTNYETNKREHIHRVSFRIFKGEIPEGLYVCHHCDNRKCIAPHHLFLGTAKENMQDAKIKGRLEHIKLMHPKGEKNTSSKLKESDMHEIRKLFGEGIKCTVIARKYSVSSSVIYGIRDGKGWKHVS